MTADSSQSELVRQFIQNRDVLYAFVFALARDHDVAEELLQEIGVAILAEAKRGTAPANFMAWARQVARHRTADYYRRRSIQRRHEVQLEYLDDVIDQAFAEHASNPDRIHQHLIFLRTCVERLAQRARYMLDLRYQGQKSLDEIAVAVGWKPASVKVALSRARRTLADCVSRKLRRQEGAS